MRHPSEFKTFVSVDVETTGLDTTNDEVLSIGAIRFDFTGKELGKYYQLFKPRKGFILPQVTELTGIRYQDVSDRMAYEDFGAPKKIRSFCNDYPLVGHDILSYGVRFLAFEYVETPEVFDTMDMAKKLFGKNRMLLSECCNKLDIDRSNEKPLTSIAKAKLAMLVFLRIAFPVIQEKLALIDIEKPKEQPVVAPVVINKVETRVDTPTDKPSILNGILRIPFSSDEKYHWWKPTRAGITLEQIASEAVALT